MRGKNLVKLLTAIDLFAKPAGVTIDDLSDELGIDRRSVYRLINVVQELGFPIYDDKDPLERKKRWKLEETYLKKLPNLKLPDLNLTMSEIIALYLIKGQERLYKGTAVGKRIDSAFAKLDAFVPDGLSEKLNKVKTLFVPSSKFAKDYTGKEEIIERLTEAILQKITCKIKYHSFYDDKIKTYNIDPLSFFENDGGLYAFVNVTSRSNIIVLAVERILELEPTEDCFEYPDDFDPEELLDSAFNIVYDDPVDLKVWFSADQARFIKERTWARGQKITEKKDGGIVLEIKTSGMCEIKRWILSFGSDAKVLKPKKLKDEIVSALKATGKNYK